MQVPDRFRRRLVAFNAMVDAELIAPFHKYIYYPTIIVFTLHLMLFAKTPPEGIDEVLDAPAYYGWLSLGSLFPALSLFGRHLYDSALATTEDEPNSAYGGARLMLTGDAGVWLGIIIYLACIVGTSSWDDAYWGLAFEVMGVPGGAIFTYRSWRRMRQIQRRLA
jgi:hypothetical protein